MEYIRKTVDSSSLSGVFDIPASLRNKQVEVIILPVEKAAGAAKRERQLDFVKAPPLPDSFFDPLPDEELRLWGL